VQPGPQGAAGETLRDWNNQPTEHAMTRWLRLVNASLYLAACTLAATGLALEWKIEAENEGQTLLGLNGEAWGECHFIVALVVLALVVIHLALHWAWISNVMAKLRAPVLAVIVAGLALIAVALMAPVGGAGGGEARQQQQQQPNDD